ncbi:hypothetical protein B5X24_HaOG210624 [Helicoverpa armigera]|nr:uncharacterized protein LOC110372019 [Helicoverpa armigera]PZC82321.1 hypothetical protein B5X24_HaOG210624 [Helicoverpa armigera]
MEFSVVVLLSTLCYVDAFSRRRCLFYDKECVDHCPRDMHAYHTRCDGETRSQRTCTNRFTYIIGYTCGWSRCDCNGDLVLDEESGHCIDLLDCPKQLPRRSRDRTLRKNKPFHIPRRVHTHDLVDPYEKTIRSR